MIVLGTSLGALTAPVLFANSNSDAPNATEKKDSQLKHGKNGKDGQDGEDGQNGGNGSNEEDSSPNAATRLPSEQVLDSSFLGSSLSSAWCALL